MPFQANRSGRPSRQQGVILILALFIVMLVTTVVVSVSWRFTLSMARNENRWHGAQAHAYLSGGEQVARLLLQFDGQMSQNDHLWEEWAQDMGALPTDEGWIRGRLEDAQGRINLNLLVPNPPTTGGSGTGSGTGTGQQNQGAQPQRPPAIAFGGQFSPMQRLFIRFLQTIELEEGPVTQQVAIEITEAIQDWLDPDDNPTGAMGAERSYYQSQNPPYPITNGPMATVSELSMVRGVTPELFNKLLPYVIVLPTNAYPNINTLKPELLRGFNRPGVLEPLPEPDWNQLIQDREERRPLEDSESTDGGYKQVSDFVESPVVSAILGSGDQTDPRDEVPLEVSSSYFLLEGETLVGEQVRRRKSILMRDNQAGGATVVVRRTDANF